MVESEINSWFGVFDDLSSDDQVLVARLVKAGGAIRGTLEEITQRLKRSRNLALLRVKLNNRIVGVAALKTPTKQYRADKFAAASVPIAAYDTALELGYVVVAKDMRAKSYPETFATQSPRRSAGLPAFAATDSSTMKKNLQRSGFTKVGREWQGRKGALSLWIITPG